MRPIKLIFFLLLFTNLSLYSQQIRPIDSLSIAFNKLKETSKIDKKDRTILKLLNRMYDEILQADNGGLSNKTLTEYQTYKNDPTLANWHIFYLFDNYQNEIIQTEFKNKPNNKSLRLALMKILSGELVTLYHEIPPIVLVYMGEALMNAGMKTNAENHFKTALEFYPNSTPIKVYNYLLSQNKYEKEKLYDNLIKNNKNHWMVKQYLNN